MGGGGWGGGREDKGRDGKREGWRDSSRKGETERGKDSRVRVKWVFVCGVVAAFDPVWLPTSRLSSSLLLSSFCCCLSFFFYQTKTLESLRAARTCTLYGNERPVASLNRPCAAGTHSEIVGTTENSHDFS